MSDTHYEMAAVDDYENMLAEYEKLARDFATVCSERDRLLKSNQDLAEETEAKVELLSNLVVDLDFCRVRAKCKNCERFIDKHGCVLELDGRVNDILFDDEDED